MFINPITSVCSYNILKYFLIMIDAGLTLRFWLKATMSLINSFGHMSILSSTAVHFFELSYSVPALLYIWVLAYII